MRRNEDPKHHNERDAQKRDLSEELDHVQGGFVTIEYLVLGYDNGGRESTSERTRD